MHTELHVFLTVHLGTNLVNNQFDTNSYAFISLLYMFRETPCSSSGESIVSIPHLVYVTLCRWPSSVQIGNDMHSRRSPTQSDKYQMLYWYYWFYWRWARCCSKHVEKWNKCRGIVRQVGCLQDMQNPVAKIYRNICRTKIKVMFVPRYSRTNRLFSTVLEGTRG
jgi:hypothetical protein